MTERVDLHLPYALSCPITAFTGGRHDGGALHIQNQHSNFNGEVHLFGETYTYTPKPHLRLVLAGTRGFHWLVQGYTLLPSKATVASGVQTILSKVNNILLDCLDYEHATFRFTDRLFALDDLHLSAARFLGVLDNGDGRMGSKVMSIHAPLSTIRGFNNIILHDTRRRQGSTLRHPTVPELACCASLFPAQLSFVLSLPESVACRVLANAFPVGAYRALYRLAIDAVLAQKRVLLDRNFDPHAYSPSFESTFLISEVAVSQHEPVLQTSEHVFQFVARQEFVYVVNDDPADSEFASPADVAAVTTASSPHPRPLDVDVAKRKHTPKNLHSRCSAPHSRQPRACQRCSTSADFP